MMKTMLKGLKMTTLIEVDGKLLKTSSPWSEGRRSPSLPSTSIRSRPTKPA